MIKKVYTRRRLFGLLALICLTLTVASFLPALFRNETAIQIRAFQQGSTLPDGFYVYQRLNAEGIHIKSITPDRDTLVIKFDSQEQSIAAEKMLRRLLPEGFSIAQPERTDSSAWLSRLHAHKQNIG